MYQHQYYLNADKYKNSEKMVQTNLEPPSKVPKASKDYIDLYNYVLPFSRTIFKYECLQATQEKTDAGVALFNNIKSNKATLNYETTSKSNTDGKWPTFILNFNNGKNFHLGHVKADFLFSTKYENPRCVMPLFHLNVLNVHGI